MVRDDDLFGDGVNVAARLEGLARPGGVCVSGSTFEQVKHKLSLGFEDLGPQEVKNIVEPVSAFRIVPVSVSVAAGVKAPPSPKRFARWPVFALVAAVVVIFAAGAVTLWQAYLHPAPTVQQAESSKEPTSTMTSKTEEQESQPPKHTPSQDTQDLFLRAKRITPASGEQVLDARRMFQKVIELDPKFAGGYAGSSWTHSLAVLQGFSKSLHEDTERAFELAQKAMAVDDSFGGSHNALAAANLVRGQNQQAVAVAERAVELQPDDADAHAYLGLYLMWDGRADEAIAPIKKSLRQNPQVAFSTGPYLNFSGFAYFTADRYEEAIAAFDENAKRGGPTGVEVLAYAAASYSELGQVEEAKATVQELLEKYSEFSLRSWTWLRLYKNLEDWKRLLDIFRKAGLPEVGVGQAANAKTFAYVFNEGSSNISVIDIETQDMIATVDAGLRIRWFSNRFFDGKRVWTIDADFKNAEVIVFDPWTLQTIKRIPFGSGPSMSLELSLDLKHAITISPGTDEVVVIDTANYEIVRRIPVGKFPCDLTLSPDGKHAFIVERDQDTLSIIDWQSGRTLKTVALEDQSRPHMLTLSPDGTKLWVQERDAGKLSVYDAKTLERVTRVPVGRAPITTEFTPSGRTTITTHLGEEFLKIFDAESLGEIKTIQVGQSPVNSIVEPTGRYAYVTNRQSNSVSVIDTELWEEIKTIKVGTNPFGIYLFNPSLGTMAGNR
jgi:YVTN family beta-propeller protein